MTDANGATSKPTLSSLIGGLAGDLAHYLAKGDVAELRRMRPSGSPPPAFWKIAVHRLEPAGELSESDSPATESRVRQWAMIVRCLAENRDLHDPQVPGGRALANADVAEGRVLRLLRAHGSGLEDALRVLSHTLASKQQHANWTDFAYVVLTDGTAGRDRARRHIARHYYRALTAESEENQDQHAVET